MAALRGGIRNDDTYVDFFLPVKIRRTTYFQFSIGENVLLEIVIHNSRKMKKPRQLDAARNSVLDHFLELHQRIVMEYLNKRNKITRKCSKRKRKLFWKDFFL